MAANDKSIVGETFWLNFAAENIYSTFEKRKTAVENLRAMITWIFGIFSTGGFISALFTKPNELPGTSIALIAIAFFLFIIAYGLAGEALNPVKASFHPNDTIAIADAFSAAVKHQANYFRVASWAVLAGFFLVATGVLFVFSDLKKPAVKLPGEKNPLYADASFVKNGAGCSIPVNIITDPAVLVTVIIVGQKKNDMVLSDKTFKTGASGRLFIPCEIPKDTFDSYKLKVGLHIVHATGDTADLRFVTIKIPKTL